MKRSAVYLLPHRGSVLQLTQVDRRRLNKRLVEDGECLVWQGGDEVLWLPKYGLMVQAKRAAWVFGGGEITNDEPFVVSACPKGNPACCAFEHLTASACSRPTRRKVRRQRTKAKPVLVRDGVKLLGLARRPTDAQVIGRKPRVSNHRRTCREMYEARKAKWLAKKHELEMERLEKAREEVAREERRRERQERREVLGW